MKQEKKNFFRFFKIFGLFLVLSFLVIISNYAFKYLKEKAYETSYYQEKSEQMQVDVIKDLKNPAYLTWEELENKIINVLDSKDKSVLIMAINSVLEEYVVKMKDELTSLTEEQVQKIIVKKLNEKNIGLLTEKEIADLIKEIANSKVAEKLSFELNENGKSYSVVGIGNCTLNEIYIPNQYNGLPVVEIKDYAFYRCNVFTTIVVSNSIRKIGEYAFSESTLQTIVFEEKSSVESIGKAAFERSKLISIIIPDRVMEIETETFNYCENLNSVVIPDNVISIKEYAFYHCKNLNSIIIRDDVEEIGKHTFGFCLNLNIYCEANSQPDDWDIEWNPNNRPVTWGYIIDENGESSNHIESDWIIVKEATCKKTGLKEKHCEICGKVISRKIIEKLDHTIVIDSPVEATCIKTGLTAGIHCEICYEIIVKQEVIPQKEHKESDWIIIKEATCNKTGLQRKHCEICEQIISEEIIEKSSHLLIIDPEVKATCYESGFSEGKHCKICFEIIIKQEVIPQKEHVRSEKMIIEEPTCWREGIEGIKCKLCGEILEQEQISKSDHTPVKIEAVEATCLSFGATEGWRCRYCTEILVAPEVIEKKPHVESVWIIKKNPTCYESGLKIKKCRDCLMEIKTEYIEKIEHNYQNGKCTLCNTLKTSEGLSFKLIENGYEVKRGVCKDQNIVIPSEYNGLPVIRIGTKAFYGSSITSIEIPNTVVEIWDSAFENCTNLRSITIPSSIKRIYEYSFKGCTAFESIYIPNNVEILHDGAFMNCTNLKTAILNMNSKHMNNFLFSGCTSLSKVEFPSGLKDINYQTFYKCTSLTSIVIPEGVVDINGSFGGCTNLKSVVLPTTLKTISQWEFSTCTSLEELTIHEIPRQGLSYLGLNLAAYLKKLTITGDLDIEANALNEYMALEEVIIAGKVRIIGDKAFNFCISLKKIFIPDSVEYIGEAVFNDCPNLTIYCEWPVKPATWGDNWNPDNYPVVWRYKY